MAKTAENFKNSCHEFHEFTQIQFVIIRGIRGKKNISDKLKRFSKIKKNNLLESVKSA